MNGPMIDIDQVNSAIGVVDSAIGRMHAVSSKVLTLADASGSAMQAQAGAITAAAYGDLGGAAKALAEELDQLRADLGALIQVAQAGADQAAYTAQHAMSLSVAAGM